MMSDLAALRATSVRRLDETPDRPLLAPSRASDGPLTLSTISSSRTGQTISWNWNRPSNANFFQTTNSDASFVRYTGTGQALTTYNNPYNVQQCGKVRAAYSERLSSWGYWSNFSNTSCETPPIPAPSSCSVSTVSSSAIRVTINGGVNVQSALAGGSWVGGSVRTISGLRPSTTYTVYGRSTANGGASGNVACSGATAAVPAPSIPAGCITTNTGTMGPGLKNAVATLCPALADRYKNDMSDPEHIKGAWLSQAYDDVDQQWLKWSAPGSGPFGGQAATVTAWTQVSVPPVTKVRFKVTLTNGSGSVTQTVTVTF